MYIYDQYDQTLVNERVAQFRGQTRRFLAGELTEDEFRPLRLMNGLYIQRHAPMLRISIPYGLLASRQLRMLASVARRYDKGYGHFTTRQNMQLNWPRLEDVPDILADLATVQMHAIQTSGNCIRNITSDHLAGIAADEIEDPRPYCEIIRQWATFHPEFSYLPRKFKIAVSGSADDRAVIKVHDIGLQLVRNEAGEIGFEVYAGGGLGRTPIIGELIRPFVHRRELLPYLEAILRIYNLQGRRDNIHKARIKILVKALGAAEFARQVEREFEQVKDHPDLLLDDDQVARMQQFFAPPAYEATAADDDHLRRLEQDPSFARWHQHNTVAHKQPGYRAVFLSLKTPGVAPGDITSDQMDAVADLADRYNFGEIRVLHTQNLLFADIRQGDLYALWQALKELKLATPTIGTLADMIACPGLDFCSLANASSISVAEQIHDRFDDLDYVYDLGELRINMSGCMNACGHHHLGHIGILGVDKKGEEFYQLTLGGTGGNQAALGDRLGPAVAKHEVADTIARILEAYVGLRDDGERFLDTVRRVGVVPFRESVYGAGRGRERTYA
jgi:sulfite reductase (NADPH) hemoprotein beta-component